jgi:transcription elongation factor Elf1
MRNAPIKAQKQKQNICPACGQVKKVITVVVNGGKKTCWECGCGIIDKSGRKIVM